jgi:hypothetical protein
VIVQVVYSTSSCDVWGSRPFLASGVSNRGPATPFHRTPHCDDITFTAKTVPFFPALSKSGDEIGAISSTTFNNVNLHHSSHFDSFIAHNSNVVEDQNDTLIILFNIPNIRDGQGRLILPTHYHDEIQDNSIVALNVHLNLYVLFLLLFLLFCAS